MKRTFFATAIVAVFTGILFAQSPNQRKNEVPNEDISRVLMDLQRQEDDAEIKKDTVALKRILSDDFSMTIPAGTKVTKADYIKAMEQVSEPDMTFKGYVYDDFRAKRFGDAAIANYTVTFTYQDKAGKEEKRRFRNTVFWAMQNGSWRTATWCSTPF
jgi:hypothetical protein